MVLLLHPFRILHLSARHCQVHMRESRHTMAPNPVTLRPYLQTLALLLPFCAFALSMALIRPCAMYHLRKLCWHCSGHFCIFALAMALIRPCAILHLRKLSRHCSGHFALLHLRNFAGTALAFCTFVLALCWHCSGHWHCSGQLYFVGTALAIGTAPANCTCVNFAGTALAICTFVLA